MVEPLTLPIQSMVKIEPNSIFYATKSVKNLNKINMKKGNK